MRTPVAGGAGLPYSSMSTSSTRPPGEIGFLMEDEIVNNCVEVQNSALPNDLISVFAAWRSSNNANKRADQVHAHRHDDHGNHAVTQAAMRRRARSRHRVCLGCRCSQHSMHATGRLQHLQENEHKQNQCDRSDDASRDRHLDQEQHHRDHDQQTNQRTNHNHSLL